jgi:hypothetical protein
MIGIFKNTIKLSILVVIFCFASCFSFSQILKGIVLDAHTNSPIESASVYFDNTTIGTSTNNKGEFIIDSPIFVTSPLVISVIAYDSYIIDNPNSDIAYKILLIEKNSELDDVLLTYFDGMSKDIKFAQFRAQFLGTTENGLSCKINNEDDLLLRFNKETNQLKATSKNPMVVTNNSLNYEIKIDINEFVIHYNYVDIELSIFKIESVFYKGTSFYKTLDQANKTIKKQRKRAYKGSVLHFMRPLATDNLNNDDYQLFSREFLIDQSRYISLKKVEESNSIDVKMKLPLFVLYNNDLQTDLNKHIQKNKREKDSLLHERLQKLPDTFDIST